MYAILFTGAALVGLPVLLHLILKQEPKRLVFPAVRFLQQSRRTNERKMRLRHFLLLLLRCLLIALFCAALIQPKLPSAGLVNLAGDAPVAAVLVIDTSPSMGYTADAKTRLDEARRRALELIDELPSGSKVAVVDPAEPVGVWEQSTGDARRKVEAMKDPRGGGPPVTAGLMTAYQLLKAVDQEAESTDPLARLVVVFSDRTAECWRADRADDLKKAAEQVPPPAVAQLFVDVGADRPADVAITAADVRPQLARVGQPVQLTVSVQAIGPDVPSAVVRCTVDNAASPERKEIAPLPAGTPRAVTFTLTGLKAGWHQAEVRLETADALEADNVRYVTFRVGEARKILTISDDPSDAVYWQLSHKKVLESPDTTRAKFDCDLQRPDQVTDLGNYEVVCLLSVADPTQIGPGGTSLWQKLADYVRRGGHVLVIPGGGEPNPKLAAYDPTNPATAGLLPGKLTRVDGKLTGVSWVTDADAIRRHPLLAPFKEWTLSGTTDFVRNPRKAYRFWEVRDYPPESVAVAYNDSLDPAKRSPAVLEKTFPGGGKLLLLTVRMDSPWPEPEYQDRREWHDYWALAESSWAVAFPNLLAAYLAGADQDAAYNFTTGQVVTIPLPKNGGFAGKTLVLEGPGLSGRDAEVAVSEGQSEVRIRPPRTLTAGNFVLRSEDRLWQEGFSLNPPAEETNLQKVPAEAIEAVFGPNSVLPVEKDLKLGELLTVRFDPEIRLFPWLLIGVLILFAVEGWVANRFYRLRGRV